MTASKKLSRPTNVENLRAAATIMLLATGWFLVVMFLAYELLKAVK